MRNTWKYILLVITLIGFNPTGFAQEEKRTISVSGTSEHNLSPNEIVIQLSYQEYFTDDKESAESKVTIETLEDQVTKAVKKIGVADDKITSGGVTVVRPGRHNAFKKRRLNKSMYVCVSNTDEYVSLTRSLEEANLFDEVMTTFTISQYRHTEREQYITKSRALAYQDAKNKADLILAKSGEKVGEVIEIKEWNSNSSNSSSGGFYSVDNQGSDESGFKPIVISYRLEVVFEIE